MTSALVGVTCYLVAVVLLLWQYPWAMVHGRFGYGSLEAGTAYSITALVMTSAVMLTHFAIPKILPRTLRFGSRTLAAGAAIFVGMIGIALLFGPLGANVPGTQVRAVFFAEWQFTVFVVLALPYAAICALVLGTMNRIRTREG